jgi:hypothetical protein
MRLVLEAVDRLGGQYVSTAELREPAGAGFAAVGRRIDGMSWPRINSASTEVAGFCGVGGLVPPKRVYAALPGVGALRAGSGAETRVRWPRFLTGEVLGR